MSYAGEGESESTWARRRRKVMQWGIASISVGLLAACGQAPHESASSATTAGTATPVLREYWIRDELTPLRAFRRVVA